MATVTARALPWYAPSRVARALRQVRRYPVVALSLLMFLLVIPAVLAPLVAPYDLVGLIGDACYAKRT